jgi:hypothetical protein
LLAAAPVALLLAHGLLAEQDPGLVFGLDATRTFPASLRWAWLGLGLAAAVSAPLREALRRGVLRLGALPWPARLGAAVLLLTALRCQNFYLGDSYHLIHAVPRGLWVHWNEPLDLMLHALAYRALALVAALPTAEPVYAALSIGAGLAYLFVPGRMAGALGLAGAARGLFVGMMLTCGGMQLFFGYAESYTLCALVGALYLAAALEHLRDGRGIGRPALLFGLAVCLHPLSLTLGPSLLFLALARPGRLRSVARAALCAALPIALLVAGVTLAGHGLWLIGHKDLPGGGDHRMLVPLFGLQTRFERYTLLSPAHLVAVFNELMLLSPLFLPMLALGRRALGRSAAAGFLAVAAAGLLLFVGLWNPDLGPARDWDLFAPAAFPLTALGAALLAGSLDAEELKSASVLYPLACGLVSLAWIVENSARAMPPPGWRG